MDDESLDDESKCSRLEHRPSPATAAPLLQPDDFDFPCERLELRVAGDEFGFALFRERGGEGIGEAEFVAGFEVGGDVGKRARSRVELNRERGKLKSSG